MNDRECLRTSTNVWRSLCDHCELMANCIRKPIRHAFATGETSKTFETPQKRPRMLTNSYECLAIICDHCIFMANCIRNPFAIYSPQCEASITTEAAEAYLHIRLLLCVLFVICVMLTIFILRMAKLGLHRST